MQRGIGKFGEGVLGYEGGSFRKVVENCSLPLCVLAVRRDNSELEMRRGQVSE